jgi:hypothetical protein
MPTPVRQDLEEKAAAAEDVQRLRKQLEALREAELEMAAREAEETARGFAMLVSCQLVFERIAGRSVGMWIYVDRGAEEIARGSAMLVSCQLNRMRAVLWRLMNSSC